MKKISVLLILLFFGVISFAQSGFPNTITISNNATLYKIKGAAVADSGLVFLSFPDTTTANLGPYIKFTQGLVIRVAAALYYRDVVMFKWISLGGGGGGGASIPGGPITTIPVVGTNPGTSLASSDWIINTFYGSQPPTATLTGGGTFEFTSASTFNTTLNWGASRQSATSPLQTIVVAGNNKTFSQPSAPGTVSGTQAVSVTTNTSTTYNNVVTTTDGKSATASTTFVYQNKIYAGFVSSATPSDADIIAATGSTYVGGKFLTTRLQSGGLSTPPSRQYFIFAAPASFGTPVVIVNGLTVAFNLTTRTFVNASGFSSSYIIAVSPNSTAGSVDSYSVQ